MTTLNTEDCFFDLDAIEAEDLRAAIECAIAEDDVSDLAPLASLTHLPAPSSDYIETVRFLESVETSTPLAETRGHLSRTA